MKVRKMLVSPLFVRSQFYCEYCGIDLLSHPRLFQTIVLDHLTPRHAGGGDGHDNLRVSCAACDRIKGGRVPESEAEVRAFLEQFHASMGRWFQTFRATFRAGGAA